MNWLSLFQFYRKTFFRSVDPKQPKNLTFSLWSIIEIFPRGGAWLFRGGAKRSRGRCAPPHTSPQNPAMRQWLLPRTWANTNSILNVYLVFKIRFIKYRFLKRTCRLRGRKEAQLEYTNNRLQRFLVPSFQSCFMPRHLTHMMYQLNYAVSVLNTLGLERSCDTSRS
jgi:hypothetical protein